jgi:hypothetical protein
MFLTPAVGCAGRRSVGIMVAREEEAARLVKH